MAFCARAIWQQTSAPVAQLDRAPDYESGGQGFESLRVYHFFQFRSSFPQITEPFTSEAKHPSELPHRYT